MGQDRPARWSPVAGLSLVECIIGIFLMTMVMLVMISLFQNGLRYGAKTQRLVAATRACEDALAGIRVWAEEPNNFTSNWALYDGASLALPDHPGVSVDVRVLATTGASNSIFRQIYSPCTNLESIWVAQPEGARVLRESVVVVDVSASYGGGAADRVELTAHLGAPVETRMPGRVVINRTGGSPDPVPSAPDLANSPARAEFTAHFEDSAGNRIPDMMFQWSLIPDSAPGIEAGNGTLEPLTRDGTQAAVLNRYQQGIDFTDPLNPVPNWVSVAGRVGIESSVRYHGTHYPVPGSPAAAHVEMDG